MIETFLLITFGIGLQYAFHAIFARPLCEACGAKAMPNQTRAMIKAQHEADRWKEKYRVDLHNFMELDRWLEKHHPEVLDEFESATPSTRSAKT